MHAERELRRLWYVVRLGCTDAQCHGYFVVRKRRNGYRFAGCSEWMTTQCRQTMGSVEYVRRKAEVCIALWANEPPASPYLYRTQAIHKDALRISGERALSPR